MIFISYKNPYSKKVRQEEALGVSILFNMAESNESHPNSTYA